MPKVGSSRCDAADFRTNSLRGNVKVFLNWRWRMKTFATVTVIGRDKTGVIAKITNFLFFQKANIEALEEQVTRGQFSMTLQASWPASHLARERVRDGLSALARELDMEIRLRFAQPGRRQRMALMVTREKHCFDAIL